MVASGRCAQRVALVVRALGTPCSGLRHANRTILSLPFFRCGLHWAGVPHGRACGMFRAIWNPDRVQHTYKHSVGTKRACPNTSIATFLELR